ncbi:hypothetical protein HDA40_002722 [Hamadaea flava]|uniref:ABC transporter n=1 Tax=Hamadaea flava TaxID=1742688 RepID=A0ABV8LI34_9ACTN|nr:hypothetical protein [Hamadaea flava]MCP2324215.1 hypothetical protein [Hamadaea flava]
MLTRARLLTALLLRSVTLTALAPVLAGSAIALVTVAITLLANVEIGLPGAALLTRLAAVAVALGVGFTLDDPAARTTVVVPMGALIRRTVKVLPAAFLGGTTWTAAAALSRLVLNPDERPLFPWGGLAVEAAALTALALALACLGLRRTDGEHGGLVAAPGLLLLVLAAVLLRDQVRLFIAPDDPSWERVHGVWGVIGALTLVVALLLGHDRRLTIMDRSIQCR